MKSTFKVINGLVRDRIIARYAVTGAVAALNYLEPVLTEDLDILISVQDMTAPRSGLVILAPVFAHLANAGYTDFKREGLLIEGWPVQFLPVADDLDAEGLDQAIVVTMPDESGEALSIKLLRPEHLVATALKVGRFKDEVRIRSFLAEGKVDHQALAGVLDRHDLWDRWRSFCQRAGIDDPATVELKA